MPAVRDTLAAFTQQGGMWSDFIFPNRDQQYKSREDIAQFMADIAAHPNVGVNTPPTATLPMGRLSATFAAGTHHGHTHAPTAYRAMEGTETDPRDTTKHCEVDGQRSRRFSINFPGFKDRRQPQPEPVSRGRVREREKV